MRAALSCSPFSFPPLIIAMRRILFRIVPIITALALVPHAARGQTPDTPGTVEGRAVGSADGAPVAFALVRLIPLPDGQPRSMLTREDGGFRFTGVAPGTYRLRLERIGFQTETSEPVAVGPGEKVAHTFRSAPRTVRIAGVTGVARNCFTADQLDRESELAALWSEARKGVETKREFDREYVYSYHMIQLTRRDLVRPRPGEPAFVHDTIRNHIVNDPRRRRVRPDRGWQGFGREKGIELDVRIPDGTEILDPAFLTTHCLESGFTAAGDVWEIDFRPVRVNRGRYDVRGTVRVDRETFRLHSMELEYLKGSEAFVTANIVFRDARAPGGTLRLPTLITFSGHPVGQAARVVRRVEGTVEYTGWIYLQTPVSEGRN